MTQIELLQARIDALEVMVADKEICIVALEGIVEQLEAQLEAKKEATV